MKSASKTQRAKLFADLNELFGDLLTTHYQLCEFIESDESLSAHGTVGGLSLDDYLTAIETTFTEATESYSTGLSQDIDE